LTADGTQVGDTGDSVNGLVAGGRATWEAFASEDFAECRVRITSAFETD